MTLTSTTVRKVYDGDGATVAFPTTFVFWDPDDLLVILRDSDGNETTWVRGTQYTVSGGSGSTGTVTVDTSPTDYTPASGETLVILSNVPDTQETSLPQGGPFPSTSVEQELDKMVRRVQQTEEAIGRTLILPITTPAGVSSELPNPSASTLVGWNASADALINHTPNTAAYITSAAVTFLEAIEDDLAGNGLSIPRVNAAGDSYELRTPAQVRSDIGADFSSVGVDVLPDTDSTRDLGSSTKAWAETHTDALFLPERASAPSTAASQVGLYTKNSGTQPELFMREESSGDEVRVTRNGLLNTVKTRLMQTLTGGSSIEFTSLPAGIQEISMPFFAVSGSTGDNFLIQLQTGSGFVTSGYFSFAAYQTASSSGFASSTSGFVIINGGDNRNVGGCLTLRRVGNNVWTATGTFSDGVSNLVQFNSGFINLQAEMTGIRLSTSAGTFDANSGVNIHYKMGG